MRLFEQNESQEVQRQLEEHLNILSGVISRYLSETIDDSVAANVQVYQNEMQIELTSSRYLCIETILRHLRPMFRDYPSDVVVHFNHNNVPRSA